MSHAALNRLSAPDAQPFPFAKEAGLLRIMSYNIRIDHVDDRANTHAWANRRESVARILDAVQPDIVAIQEANPKQIDDLCSLLPRYRKESFPAGQGHVGEESLLFLYNGEELELHESAVFSLSPTPGKPGIGWDARYARSLVFAKFRSKKTQKILTVINTHFDHVGVEARLEGARVLLSVQNVLAKGLPCAVMGDFNLYPHAGGEELYALFVDEQTGLRDVRDVSAEPHYGPDGTWIGWEYEPLRAPDGKAGWRLDHIFVRESLKVVRTGVIGASVDGSGQVIPDFLKLAGVNRNYPSDHLPIVADLLV